VDLNFKVLYALISVIDLLLELVVFGLVHGGGLLINIYLDF